MNCLNCNSLMATLLSDGGVEYDQCPTCGSAWLDHGEFQALTSRPVPGWSEAELAQRLRPARRCRWCEAVYPAGEAMCATCDRPISYACPRDGVVMSIVEFKGVEVDVCGECYGVWFDQQELDQLLKAFRGRGGRGGAIEGVPWEMVSTVEEPSSSQLRARPAGRS